MIDPHPCQHQEIANNLSATFHHLYIWESLQVWYCSLSETTPVGFHGSSPLLSKRHSSYKTADTSCECHPWTWTVDTHDFSSIEFENINRWNSIFNLTSTYEATLECPWQRFKVNIRSNPIESKLHLFHRKPSAILSCHHSHLERKVTHVYCFLIL